MTKFWIITTLIVGLSGVAIAWGLIGGEPPEWQEVQRIQEELRTSMQSDRENESAEVQEKRKTLRWEKMEEYREKIETLPEQLQTKAREQMRNLFVSRMQQKIDLVLSLPPEERNEELDKQIDEWDRRMADWEKRREQQNAKVSEKKNTSEQETESNNSAEQNGEKSGKKKTARRHGWWSNASKEQRDTWRRELLSRTTAEDRAKWHEYRRLIENRRKERGF